ncbi:MAG: hypothetical protein H0U75_02710 [Legionella sp.]|nr:hypothetical protein [Legionella sp.]
MRKFISQCRLKLKITINNGSPQKSVPYFFYSYSEALLHLADLTKNALDTFTPYKTKAHRRRDLMQLFHGLQNTVLAAFILFIIPFVWLVVLIKSMSLLFKRIEHFLPQLKHHLYGFGSDLLGAIILLLRGIVEIATSPLCLCRMIWRSLLSKNNDWETFQDRKSIIGLVSQADEILDSNCPNSVGSIRKVIDALARKALSNATKKQACIENQYLPTYHQFEANEGLLVSCPITALRFIQNSRDDRDILIDDEVMALKEYISHFRRSCTPSPSLSLS